MLFINKLICVQLTSLELLSESVSGAMEEKDRELKRARTVRADYKRDVDEVQDWIRKAELKVKDRSAEPVELKEYLTVSNENRHYLDHPHIDHLTR